MKPSGPRDKRKQASSSPQSPITPFDSTKTYLPYFPAQSVPFPSRSKKSLIISAILVFFALSSAAHIRRVSPARFTTSSSPDRILHYMPAFSLFNGIPSSFVAWACDFIGEGDLPLAGETAREAAWVMALSGEDALVGEVDFFGERDFFFVTGPSFAAGFFVTEAFFAAGLFAAGFFAAGFFLGDGAFFMGAAAFNCAAAFGLAAGFGLAAVFGLATALDLAAAFVVVVVVVLFFFLGATAFVTPALLTPFGVAIAFFLSASRIRVLRGRVGFDSVLSFAIAVDVLGWHISDVSRTCHGGTYVDGKRSKRPRDIRPRSAGVAYQRCR